MTRVKKKAGVLGATGSVGQRFILLLSDHPNFDLVKVGASQRSAGKKYCDAVDWKQTTTIPDEFSDLVVVPCKAAEFQDCDVVFSGLDSDVAGEVEKEFVEAGLNVVSNAKNYRRDPDVPLIVPTVNSQHLDMFKIRKPKKGIHVCISNCSTAGVVVPLKALQQVFGPISICILTTLQALSGAGFSPGVPSMAIIDNLIPFISGEEDKLEWEPRKILCDMDAETGEFKMIPADDMKISATTTRVPVTDGHTACVSLKFAKQPAPSIDEVKRVLANYKVEAQKLNCHSAPDKIIEIMEQPDRPQPRLDRDRGNGYAVSVGRIRPDPALDLKLITLSHNTVLGAAGAGILIAELLLAKNLL